MPHIPKARRPRIPKPKRHATLLLPAWVVDAVDREARETRWSRSTILRGPLIKLALAIRSSNGERELRGRGRDAITAYGRGVEKTMKLYGGYEGE